MTMFPPSTTYGARSRSLANMRYQATWMAPVTARDATTGETATTYPSITKVTRCRVAPMSSDEKVVADRFQEDADTVVIAPAGTQVGVDWQVLVTGIDVFGDVVSSTHQVTGVDAPRSHEVERRVRVQTIRTGAVA